MRFSFNLFYGEKLIIGCSDEILRSAVTELFSSVLEWNDFTKMRVNVSGPTRKQVYSINIIPLSRFAMVVALNIAIQSSLGGKV